MVRRKRAKKKESYRAVVVGVGAIGALLESDPRRPKPATHAGAFAHHQNVQLVGLVDAHVETLAAAAKLFPNIPTYTNVVACLQEQQPDIVAIATPPATHLSLIRACVQAHVKVIICEKPLAASPREALVIERLLQSTNTMLVLNYQRRFFSQFARVRTMLLRGKIGRIQQISCYYSNGIRANGSHSIDALQYLLDDPVVSVVGRRANISVKHTKEDMTVDGFMETRSGHTITIQGLDQTLWGVNDIHLYGERGAIFITEYGYTISHVPLRSSVFGGVRELDMSKAATSRKEESMVAGALHAAVDYLKRGTVPVSGIENGRYVEAVLAAFTKSAVGGSRKVRVLA